MSVNWTLAEDKIRRFKGECSHFSFKKCPIYTHDGASAKFSTKSHETDKSVGYKTRISKKTGFGPKLEEIDQFSRLFSLFSVFATYAESTLSEYGQSTKQILPYSPNTPKDIKLCISWPIFD